MLSLVIAANLEVVGTVGATVLASFTGVAAYVTNRRSKRVEEKANEAKNLADEADQTAELNRSEIEGWRTLIDTLMAQYKASTEESTELRVRLQEGNKRFDEQDNILRKAHERIAVLEHTNVRLEDNIKYLRGIVTKLGGDVDEINRVGKHGAKGDKGETGDKGPPGDPVAA